MSSIGVAGRKDRLFKALPAGLEGPLPLWIGGRWHRPRGGDVFPCVDPTVGEALIDVAAASATEVDAAVGAAIHAQRAWWRMDGQDRARILRRIADAVRDNAEALGTLDTLDAGRPISDTTTRDIERTARLFEFFAGTTDRLRGAVVPVQPGRTNLVEYEPIGVVGGIVPWNYPLTNAAGKIAPALATGNAVLLKPAEDTPLSALMLAWVADQAGLPPGLLNVLNGDGGTVGEAIVAHPDIGKITFTGSTAIGRRIGEVGGRLLKSLTLELGGKTGFIVFADADLERAADAFVFSAFNNVGQTCTAGSRLLIEKEAGPAFLRLIAERIGRIRIGDPLDPETRLGPAISKRHHAEVGIRLAQAAELGMDRLSLPALSTPEIGYFIAPVVFEDVDPRNPLAQEEIFGPVVTVTAFADADEAIAIANGTPYGLATTVWTSNLSTARRVSREAQSGIVWINTVHSLHPGSPYGGYRQSGVGLEMGMEAIQQHMKTKSIWLEDQWTSPWS